MFRGRREDDMAPECASETIRHMTMTPALKKALVQYQLEQDEQIPVVPGQDLLFG